MTGLQVFFYLQCNMKLTINQNRFNLYKQRRKRNEGGLFTWYSEIRLRNWTKKEEDPIAGKERRGYQSSEA